MGGYLSFDKMITPIFIKVAFWLGIIGSILGGIGLIISGIASSNLGFIQIIAGLLVFIIGPLIVRVYCELLIILFKIHESMHDVKMVLTKQARVGNHVGQNKEETS